MKYTCMGVCGTGTIGACLATLMAGNGMETKVVGHSQQGMERCKALISQNFQFLVDNGKMTSTEMEAAVSLVEIDNNYTILKDCSFVIEAVAEQVEIKRSIYEKIEAVVDENTILASSTSAITPDNLCENLIHPRRFLVAHPFQPAHLQPMVELVSSTYTSSEAIANAKNLLEEKLHRQVVVLNKGIPGFIVNRIAQAMFRECISMVEDDVASVDDIDKAIKYAVGMRYASIGLLEYFDDVGFDLEKNIAENVYPSLCNTRDVQPSVLAGISQGNTGLKTGKGLYNWAAKDVADYQLRKTIPLLDILDWDFPTKS